MNSHKKVKKKENEKIISNEVGWIFKRKEKKERKYIIREENKEMNEKQAGRERSESGKWSADRKIKMSDLTSGYSLNNSFGCAIFETWRWKTPTPWSPRKVVLSSHWRKLLQTGSFPTKKRNENSPAIFRKNEHTHSHAHMHICTHIYTQANTYIHINTYRRERTSVRPPLPQPHKNTPTLVHTYEHKTMIVWSDNHSTTVTPSYRYSHTQKHTQSSWCNWYRLKKWTRWPKFKH